MLPFHLLCCDQADDLTCELQCIMREGLAVVVETEMRAAYDDLWYVRKTDYFITRRQICTDMGLGTLHSVDSVLVKTNYWLSVSLAQDKLSKCFSKILINVLINLFVGIR